jgi:hypothetical protein
MSSGFFGTEEYLGNVVGSLGYYPGGVFGEGWSPAQESGETLEEMLSLWAQHPWD